MSSGADRRHSRIEANNLDPDEGNSWLCSACNLPIFATPFIGGGGANLLHDQCANLPEVLKECELHLEKPLLLGDNNNNQQTCSECTQKCGTKLYYCPDSDSGLVLDVACALPIKISHRSHEHRLVAVRGKSSFATCGVCGGAHHHAAARSYFCNVCGFWIHGDCATLANVIEHKSHEHPLVLYYNVAAAFGAKLGVQYSSWEFVLSKFNIPQMNRLLPQEYDDRCICAICYNNDETRFGIYSCIQCRGGGYFIHINCAISNSRIFKPVLSREARFPGLVPEPFIRSHNR